MNLRQSPFILFLLIGLCAILGFTPSNQSQASPEEIIIFKDGQLASGWENWSWETEINGTEIISDQWGAVYFRYPGGFDISNIEFVRVIHTGNIQTGFLIDTDQLPVVKTNDSFTHLIYHFISPSEHSQVDGLFLQSIEAESYELKKVSLVPFKSTPEPATPTAWPTSSGPISTPFPGVTLTPLTTTVPTNTPTTIPTNQPPSESPEPTATTTPTSLPTSELPGPIATETPTNQPTSELPEPSATATPTASPTTQVPSTSTPQPLPEPIVGEAFYVSRLGNNSDGTSWGSAWNEFANIDWNALNPGDVVLVDGGSSSMTYFTPIKPTKSGEAGRPITIRLADEAGRNGQAILFGGNGIPLPECGQLSWDDSQHRNAREAGIIFEDGVSNIVIDGRKTHGLVIHGWSENGVIFRNDFSDNGIDDTTRNNSLRFMKIYNNGGTLRKNDGSVQNLWFPDHGGAGIKLSGVGHTFDHLEIHDNGGDAIQSAANNPARGSFNNMDDLTLTNSWLYNQRPHSGVDNSPAGEVCSADRSSDCDELGAPHMGPDYHTYPLFPPNRRESFNWCNHSDGVQIFSSNDFNKMTIERSIIGPNFMTALILGDKKGGDISAWVNELSLRDVVITRYMHNALSMNNPSNNPGNNWTLERVTMYGHYNNTNKGTFHIESGESFAEHSISDSILVYGRTNFPDGNINFSNNCQWELYSGSIGGSQTDPQFASIFDEDLFEADLSVDFATRFSDNYQVNNSGCVGSQVTTPWDIR